MFETRVIYLFPPTAGPPEQQAADCLDSLGNILGEHGLETRHILMLTVFLRAEDNKRFYRLRERVSAGINAYFTSDPPPTALIGQPPAAGQPPVMGQAPPVAFELMLLTDRREAISIDRKTLDNSVYTTVSYPGAKQVYAAGLTAGAADANPLKQAHAAFEQMARILDRENMSFAHVVRQWNYIENITGSSRLEDGDKQNYQIFNDMRAIYYGRADFTNGYPAATGIGMNAGGTVLAFIAVDASPDWAVLPVHNPGQIDAHRYSQEVLVGTAIKELQRKATPKFERAKLLANEDDYIVYISGTAAIRGQETVPDDDAGVQTQVTIENIAELVSAENLRNHGLKSNREPGPLTYCRVYVKYEKDVPRVKKVCDECYDGVPVIYLIADICRPDLTVEIEGGRGAAPIS